MAVMLGSVPAIALGLYLIVVVYSYFTSGDEIEGRRTGEGNLCLDLELTGLAFVATAGGCLALALGRRLARSGAPVLPACAALLASAVAAVGFVVVFLISEGALGC